MNASRSAASIAGPLDAVRRVCEEAHGHIRGVARDGARLDLDVVLAHPLEVPPVRDLALLHVHVVPRRGEHREAVTIGGALSFENSAVLVRTSGPTLCLGGVRELDKVLLLGGVVHERERLLVDERLGRLVVRGEQERTARDVGPAHLRVRVEHPALRGEQLVVGHREAVIRIRNARPSTNDATAL